MPIKKVAKPTVKKTVKKAAPKKKVVATPAHDRRLLDTLGDVFVVREGETVTVHLTVKPEIQEVTLTLNGHGVFRGRP